MVFYRKYRPQTIEELDSENVRDALTAVLSGKSIPHAFLFTGPKGLGKTSTARIVAKAVNCERNLKLKSQNSKLQLKTQKLKNEETEDRLEPCNVCSQCVSITNGTNIDVLEIDGASNRGIDEIRDLREKVRLSPASATMKVYIIDEVHMLTAEAFNALLKTLEEPPSHVMFILCTTEPHKVPATIVSRCFQITFKKATIEELVRSFKRIAEIEKLKTDDETLKFIATLSDGSFRDGAKILEEMSVFNKKITKELVEEKYQIRQLPDQISELIEILSKRDAKEGLQLISKLTDQGVDMKYFLEQLISELHEMLLVRVGINESLKFEVRSSKFEVEEIKELVELLSKAYAELKYAVLPQLPLEMAIIEWSVARAGPAARSSKGAPSSLSGFAGSNEDARLWTPPLASPAKSVTPRSGNDKNSFWQELIDKVKKYNHSIAGVLRGCSLKSYDNKEIVIETGFKFHKDRLDDKKTMAIIEKVCEEISGTKINISVVLRGGEKND